MAELTVPAALTGGSASETVEVPGGTLGEVFDNHADTYGPELYESVIADGEIREFINVYINGKEVTDADGLETKVSPEDEIRVIPAASGGQPVPLAND